MTWAALMDWIDHATWPVPELFLWLALLGLAAYIEYVIERRRP